MTCFCLNGDEAMGNKIEWDKNDILILLGSKNEIEMVIYNMKIFNKINIQIIRFQIMSYTIHILRIIYCAA